MQGGGALLVCPAATCALAVVSRCKAYQNVRPPAMKASHISFSSPKLQMRSRPRRLDGVCCSAEQQPAEQDYIVYDDQKSVFPAEACEELGGDSCQAYGVGPEVKGSAPPSPPPRPSPSGGPDREYVDYKESKTVFPGEACDDLGGEFCEPDYQSGVFPEKVGAK